MDSKEWERLRTEFAERLDRNISRRSTRFKWLLDVMSLCRDCDRAGEFYMVSRETWRSAFRPDERPTGLLCLNCLERRLGRRLAKDEIGDGGDGPFNYRERVRRKERPVFSCDGD